MLSKFSYFFLLFIQATYCLSIGKLISNFLVSSKVPTSIAAGEAAIQKLGIVKPVPSTELPRAETISKIFPLDISDIHGVKSYKIKAKKKYSFVNSDEWSFDDRIQGIEKELRRLEYEKKQVEQQILKNQKRLQSNVEFGIINTANKNPKTAFNILTNNNVEIYYTQAFVTKHNGKPDRGSHPGTYNTIINVPEKILLSIKSRLLPKTGKAGVDIPQSFFQQLGIKYDPSAIYHRMAIPSENRVSLSSFSYIQDENKKWRWMFDSNGDKKGLIEFEGFLIPNSKRDESGGFIDVFIVDHMNRIKV